MKNFISLLKRFVSPYKKYMALNIVFNILSAILNLFTFALIMPILEILFKIDDTVYSYMEWSFQLFSPESWKALPAVAQNNFYWYVNDIISVHGGSFTLIILGSGLTVMTLLKVLSMYMAFYTIDRKSVV